MAERGDICPAFLDVAKAIASATNLPAILQLITQYTVQLTGARACSISLLDASGRRLTPGAAFGLSDEFLRMQPVGLEQEPIASEVLRGATVIIPDVSSDMRITDRVILGELGIASLTAVEIAAGQRPLGVLSVYSATPGPLPPAEMDVAYTLASLGAVGIETGRAYERVYRRCADLGVLNQVAEDINVSLRTNEVVGAIVKEVPLVLHAKACSLRLYDPKNRRITPVASYGLTKGLLEKAPINLEDSAIDVEALQGHVVTITDTATDARWRYPERAEEEGIASAIVSPMIIKGKPVGTVWVYADQPRLFSDEEKSLLLAIARHSAIAIENARLYELSVRSHDQLVQEVWRGLPDVWGSIAGQPPAA